MPVVRVQDARLEAAAHEFDPMEPDLALHEGRRVVQPRPDAPDGMPHEKRAPEGVLDKALRAPAGIAAASPTKWVAAQKAYLILQYGIFSKMSARNSRTRPRFRFRS
jgi:hypothetical protein